MTNNGNGSAAGELRAFVDRLVKLEEARRDIASDVKEVKVEAKSRGYDIKALGVLVKRAMETAADASARREHEAITELYLASLGMLDGTPLGDSARKRLMEPPAQSVDDDGDAQPGATGNAAASTLDEDEGAASRGAMTSGEIDDAREAGSAAARGGKKVIENPYVAGDPRRAAWDEGWCAATGSDGMDIPEAWKRRKPKRPADKLDGDCE